MKLQTAFLEHLVQVGQHAFADARYFKHLFGLSDQICDLLGQGLDGLSCISIRADAE